MDTDRIGSVSPKSRNGYSYRRGQALMELIVGIFTLALIVSVLAAFANGIAGSLKEQNQLRADSADWKNGNWKIEDKIRPSY